MYKILKLGFSKGAIEEAKSYEDQGKHALIGQPDNVQRCNTPPSARQVKNLLDELTTSFSTRCTCKGAHWFNQDCYQVAADALEVPIAAYTDRGYGCVKYSEFMEVKCPHVAIRAIDAAHIPKTTAKITIGVLNEINENHTTIEPRSTLLSSQFHLYCAHFNVEQ